MLIVLEMALCVCVYVSALSAIASFAVQVSAVNDRLQKDAKSIDFRTIHGMLLPFPNGMHRNINEQHKGPHLWLSAQVEESGLQLQLPVAPPQRPGGNLKLFGTAWNSDMLVIHLTGFKTALKPRLKLVRCRIL